MPSRPAPACIVTLRTPPEDALPTSGLKAQVRQLDHDPLQADSIFLGGRKTEFLEEPGEPPEDLIHPTAAVSSAKSAIGEDGEAPGAAMGVLREEPGQLLQ
ncbi:hypothetical protein C8Q77DRAFT_1155920 [Trametes polyzona]|nr:hypothetical protein C8Q77DRAFT_1155920 [Trametes polyzona]